MRNAKTRITEINRRWLYAFFRTIFWLPSLFLLLSVLCYAEEPATFVNKKQELIQYHDSGQYEKDLQVVIDKAIDYLQVRLARPYNDTRKPAIVLDIDETSLSNYQTMLKLNFDSSLQAAQETEKQEEETAINPTLKLFQFAKNRKIAVFFITGRSPNESDETIKNLLRAGYSNWDGIIFKAEKYKNKSIAGFKIAMRKKITEQGYHILLNMGDQVCDLTGGYADIVFKLPNPFYLIS